MRRALSLPDVSGWKADGLALLAGAVSALALPPDFLLPVLALGIPALVLLIDRARGVRDAARRGLAWGLGFHLVGLEWITNAILLRADQFWWAVPFAVPFLALVLAPFVAAAAAVARLAPPGAGRVAVLAGAWTLAEIVREFIFTGFPWNPLGSVWEFRGRAGDVAIQAASVVGVDGLTLLTVLAFGSLAVASTRFRAAGLGLVGLGLVFGLWRLASPIPPRTPAIDVVIAQGDVPEREKISRDDDLAVFRRYLALTREGVRRAGGVPAVVAWPEAASPFSIEGDGPALQAIATAMAPARLALVGGVRFGSDGRPRNSLFAVGPGGRLETVYDKAHLVPWGEYQPKVVPIQIIPGGGFEAGPGRATIALEDVPAFSPLICYEDIFSSAVVKDDGPRPSWLLVVTNDAWFGDSSGPRQHLAAARMRAVEEGLPVARAANTGISAVFDARGVETRRIGLDRQGVLVEALPGALPPTLFARFGLFIPGGIAALLLVAGFTRWRRVVSK